MPALGLASGPCVSVGSNGEGVCPWDSVAVGCPSVILGPAGNQTVSRKSRTWVPSSCALSWGGGGDGAASPGPGEPARLPVLPALPQPGDGVALSSQTAARPLIRSFQPLLRVLQAQVAQSCLAVFPHAGSSPRSSLLPPSTWHLPRLPCSFFERPSPPCLAEVKSPHPPPISPPASPQPLRQLLFCSTPKYRGVPG